MSSFGTEFAKRVVAGSVVSWCFVGYTYYEWREAHRRRKRERRTAELENIREERALSALQMEQFYAKKSER